MILRKVAQDEKGQSFTAFVALTLSALFIVAGLVIDGGAQAAAVRKAEGAAARAARAGADAGVAARLAGTVDVAAVRAAAQESLQANGVTGLVQIHGVQVVVDTEIQVETSFLSLIGIKSLTAKGHAVSQATPRE